MNTNQNNSVPIPVKIGLIVIFILTALFLGFNLQLKQTKKSLVKQCNIDLYLSLPQGYLLNKEELNKQKSYESFEEAFKEPEKVYSLDLSDKGIKEIPPEIGKLRNLQRLFLSNTDFPYVELFLKKNHIKDLPCEIGALTNLQYLYLNEAEFTKFPDEIKNLQNLKTLTIHSTPLPEEEIHRIKLLLPNVIIYPSTDSTEISSTPIITPSPALSHIYQLIVQERTRTNEELYNALTSALEIHYGRSTWDNIKLYYDTRQKLTGINYLNRNYYLKMDSFVDSPMVYQANGLTFTVKPLSTDIEQYLQSPKYCKTDADCVVRTDEDQCNYGALNYYELYSAGGGCSGIKDIEVLDPSGEPYYSHFEGLDDSRFQCETVIHYDYATCMNNQCIGQNRTIQCKK